jgi:hypothetical protein
MNSNDALAYFLMNIPYLMGVFVVGLVIYFIYLILKTHKANLADTAHKLAFENKINELNTKLNDYGYVISDKWKPKEDEGRIQSIETGKIVGDYVKLSSDYTAGQEIYRFSVNYLKAQDNVIDIPLGQEVELDNVNVQMARSEFNSIVDQSKLHPSQYLKQNRVSQYSGLKVSDRKLKAVVRDKSTTVNVYDLVIPVLNINNEIISYQVISDDGVKTLRIGTSIKGGFFPLGKVEQSAKRYILCEDYLTGATLHRVTKETVLVCFDLQNMRDVANAILELNEKNTLVFATGRDKLVKQNPRIRKALFYANSFNMPFIFPRFEDGDKYDHFKTWNELQRYTSDEDMLNMINAQIDYFKNTGKRNTIQVISNKYGL